MCLVAHNTGHAVVDRHSGDTEEKKKEEERLFKECGEAYAVLSDAKKKARYDAGHDLDDPSGGFSGEPRS